jgi:amino acid transporter
MRKIVIALILCVLSTVALAEEAGRYEFPGGIYYFALDANGEKTNFLVVEPNRPMMTDRFATYGNIETDPVTNQRAPNLKAKAKVTPEGLEIYDLLDRMKIDGNGFFVFQAVILRYDAVTLIKYNRVDWNDHINQILAAFKE